MAGNNPLLPDPYAMHRHFDLADENKALLHKLREITNSPSYRLASALQKARLTKFVYRLLKLEERDPASGAFRLRPIREPVIGNPTSPVLSLACEDWRGVAASTVQMYSNHWLLPRCLAEGEIDQVIDLIRNRGFSKIVFQGMPPCSVQVYQKLLHVTERPKIYAIWHGSLMQSDEKQDWDGLRFVLDATRRGVFSGIGFVKQGMAETIRHGGYTTAFLMNRVNRIPSSASVPLSDGAIHIGIWSLGETWRKTPYAMLASALHIERHMVHVSSASSRALDFMDFFGIEMAPRTRPVDSEAMPDVMAGMHLNLYVTLSECAPMLPLESLSVGVPCLLGPTCHYFEESPYLRERLVVGTPDSSQAIAEMSLRALEERTAIVSAYRDYAQAYNLRAVAAARQFVDEEEI